MDFAAALAQQYQLAVQHVENVIKLIDEGNTIPFIARYRKELTGAMDDQLLRELAERLAYLRSLEKRREEVITAIEGMGKMTDELRGKIEKAQMLAEIEDLRDARVLRAQKRRGGSRWRSISSPSMCRAMSKRRRGSISMRKKAC